MYTGLVSTVLRQTSVYPNLSFKDSMTDMTEVVNLSYYWQGLHPSSDSSMSFFRKRSLWRLTSPNQNSTCLFTSPSSCLTRDLFFFSVSLFLLLVSAAPASPPPLSVSIILWLRLQHRPVTSTTKEKLKIARLLSLWTIYIYITDLCSVSLYLEKGRVFSISLYKAGLWGSIIESYL